MCQHALACELRGGCVLYVGRCAFPCSFINNVGMVVPTTVFWVFLFKKKEALIVFWRFR